MPSEPARAFLVEPADPSPTLGRRRADVRAVMAESWPAARRSGRATADADRINVH